MGNTRGGGGGEGVARESDPPQLEAAQLAGGASKGGLPIHPPEVLGADLSIPMRPTCNINFSTVIQTVQTPFACLTL